MGKYFTEMERYKLETMLQDGISKNEIAQRLGKSLATIYNEINRGTLELLSSDLKPYHVYKADYAQRDFVAKQEAKGPGYKIGKDYEFMAFLEDKILNEKWSPQAILGYIRVHSDQFHFATNVCYKTIYNYIHAGLFLNVTEKNFLRYHRKKKHGIKRPAYHNIHGTSISQRPGYVDNREEYGHWEMDTVIGKRDGKYCLLVLSERMTRTEIIRKINGKTQDEVKRVLDDLESSLGTDIFKEHFKTITMDNGTEFLDSEKIETSADGGKRTTCYYCHPFSSWERGTNENINKMIRRWIPKGADITDYSEEQIAYIQHWINHYPRKIFDFQSSSDRLTELGFQIS